MKKSDRSERLRLGGHIGGLKQWMEQGQSVQSIQTTGDSLENLYNNLLALALLGHLSGKFVNINRQVENVDFG